MGADLVGYLVDIVVVTILGFLFLLLVITIVGWIMRLAERSQL